MCVCVSNDISVHRYPFVGPHSGGTQGLPAVAEIWQIGRYRSRFGIQHLPFSSHEPSATQHREVKSKEQRAKARSAVLVCFAFQCKRSPGRVYATRRSSELRSSHPVPAPSTVEPLSVVTLSPMRRGNAVRRLTIQHYSTSNVGLGESPSSTKSCPIPFSPDAVMSKPRSSLQFTSVPARSMQASRGSYGMVVW